MTQVTVEITRLGAKGDGIGMGPDGPLYVPRAIPGDIVAVDLAYDEPQIASIERASPHRIAPLCPLFGSCGGCLIQEADLSTYRAWKQARVVEALTPLGVASCIKPLIDAHGSGRRRVTFHARRSAHGIEIGFMRARSHDLIPIDACPLLTPGLARAPFVARTLAQRFASSTKPIDLVITETMSGLDVDLRGHGPANSSLRKSLALDAEHLDLARIAMHGETVIERLRPAIQIGRAQVMIPPGAFLQATRLGEETLASIVLQALGSASLVADLFSGVGTFALRLAQMAGVHAVENNSAALAALDRALRETQGLKPISLEERDLFKRPLNDHELARFDAVVLDPPRAGAEAQTRMLARSSVSKIISVSCHLGSFVRDAEILIKAGYRLLSVTPVDQFRYSSHIELVGVFEKDKTQAKPKRRLLG